MRRIISTTLVIIIGLYAAGCDVEAKDALKSSTIEFLDGNAVTKQLGSGTYVNPASGKGDGEVLYESDKPEIASVKIDTGEVTLLTVGSAVITAKKEATESYDSAKESYSLTVLEQTPKTWARLAAGGVTSVSNHSSFTFGNKLWIAAHAIFNTANGITWSQLSNPGIGCAIGFKDAIFGFITGKVFSSTDGIAWTPVADIPELAARRSPVLYVFKDKLWLFGGQNTDTHQWTRDLWSSVDGHTWERVTDNAFPSANEYHFNSISIVEYKNRVWLYDNNDKMWNSDDGVTWNLVAENVLTSSRMAYSMVVYNDKLWIIAGQGGTGDPLNDVRYSTDGVTWTEIPGTSFEKRSDQSCCVFNGKIYLYGGNSSNSDGINYHDIWSYLD